MPLVAWHPLRMAAGARASFAVFGRLLLLLLALTAAAEDTAIDNLDPSFMDGATGVSRRAMILVRGMSKDIDERLASCSVGHQDRVGIYRSNWFEAHDANDVRVGFAGFDAFARWSKTPCLRVHTPVTLESTDTLDVTSEAGAPVLSPESA